LRAYSAVNALLKKMSRDYLILTLKKLLPRWTYRVLRRKKKALLLKIHKL
jgi:hypothetical protein